MTITDDTSQADLRDMTLEQLDTLYYGTSDPEMQAALRQEADRRDRQERRDRAGRQLQAEWYDAMHAQRMQAEAYCQGWLLNPEARRLNAIAEETGKVAVSEWQMWTGPDWLVRKYASEELLAFFDGHPRLTFAEYKRQRSRAGRIQREEWRDRHETSERNTTHGRDRDTARPGLDNAAAGALQPGPPAPQAPQSARGTVPRDRRADSTAEAGESGDAGGRPRRPVLDPLARAAAVREQARQHRLAQLAAMRQRKAELAGRRAAQTGTTGKAHMEASDTDSTVAVPLTGTVTKPDGTVARKNDQQIPGDRLLDLLRDQWLGAFARFPSPAALDAVTLWAAHCHMRDENGILVFRATPRLYLLSSEPGSGKSHVLELLGRIVPCWHGLDLEPTGPGLVYTISREHSTVTLDEADVMLGAGSRKEAVRAIINGGTYRYGTYLNGKGAKATREPVFGPLAMAGLDTLETDTGDKLAALLSRGIKIRMEKASGQDRPPNLTRRAEDAAANAKTWLERWAAQVREQVADAEPEIPEGVEGRAEDIWTPLLAVAEAAGGNWPERARAACRELALALPEGGEDVAAEFAAFAGSFGAFT